VGQRSRHHLARPAQWSGGTRPNGLCDAIFTALPFVDPGADVLIGLPDTVWFPEDGFEHLPRNACWEAAATMSVQSPASPHCPVCTRETMMTASG